MGDPVTSTLGMVGLGGGFSYMGQKDANETNAQIASDTRAFNAEQAAINRNWQTVANQKAMDFSERMSSTAVQRRMQDMKAAGINPILAGKFDGSSPAGVSGSGSAATGAPGNPMQNQAAAIAQLLPQSINSAIGLAKLNSEIGKLESSAQLDRDTAGKVYEQGKTEPYKRDQIRQGIEESKARTRKVQQDTNIDSYDESVSKWINENVDPLLGASARGLAAFSQGTSGLLNALSKNVIKNYRTYNYNR